jgi:hypothetical protein
MTQADSVHSTPPLNTPITDAARVLDDLAAGMVPDRARLIAAALALDTLIKTTTPSRDLLNAAAGLQILATGGTLDLDETGRLRAHQFAETVRQLIVARDPIYAAIEAHQAAYAAYDAAAEGPDDENQEAFRELDRASQLLMRAEASTMAGLIALLRYVAPLLPDAGAPGFPIEITVRRAVERGLRHILRECCEELGGDRDRGLCSRAGAHRPRRRCDRRSDRTAHR